LNGTTEGLVAGVNYWGSSPIDLYQPSAVHFQHLDWTGTERMATTYNGAVEGTFQSYVFGDGFTFTGSDNDYYHFAGLDKDYYSNTDHAQFRQYSNTEGRWMSMDPYSGSYDFNDPQSLNRYIYARNNPVVFTDPSGNSPDGGTGCLALLGLSASADTATFGGATVIAGIACVAGLAGAVMELESLFFGPKFHGSLQPRPGSIENVDWATADGSFGESSGLPTDPKLPRMNWRSLSGILGLPSGGCEFGGCGMGPRSFQQGYTPGSNVYTPPLLSQSLLELLLGVDWTDRNGRLYGAHYCGNGGSGEYSTGNTALDRACAAHDRCYDASGVT
jgi:RHS repeat-associated protein